MNTMYKFDADAFKAWAKEQGFTLKLVSNIGMFCVHLLSKDGKIVSEGAGNNINAAIAHCAYSTDSNNFCENI